VTHRTDSHPIWRAPRRFAIPLLFLATAVSSPLGAQAATGRIAVERFTLSNGLEVLLAPDRTSQVVAVDVWYGAGSRDEPAGKAGLARMFERLMFAGSANLPQGSHAAIVERLGGALTAEVDEEAARFATILPSNRLNLGLWLEADRMRSLAINDTTVAQARLALLDDLGRRVNEEPYNAAIVDIVASLYDSAGCRGYSHPAIGRVGSLATLTTADAEAFFRERFVPNNARLVVAGDLDPAAARQLIGTYFGAIPRGQDPPAATCSAQPGGGTRSRSVRESRAERIAVGHFFAIPAHDHPDIPALELLSVMLSQGARSRLATALVGDLHAAAGTQGGILGDRRAPGVFGLFAIGAPEIAADSLGALLMAQARWAASDSVTEADLDRARNIYQATAVSARERPADIAELLQHAAAFHGSPDAVNTEVDRVLATTLADVRRAARTWLAPDRAVTLVVTPRAGA
jgi:predicted Zn-dependent peptidase